MSAATPFRLACAQLLALAIVFPPPVLDRLALAGLVSAANGGVVGLISLRLRGQYFAIFTLCVGIIISLVIEKWDSLTHGVGGIMNIPQPPLPGPESIAGSVTAQYYLVLAFLVGGLFFMQRIVASLLGRSFVAIRNSESLAQALGIAPMRTKVTAFMLSTFYAGIAGGLYAGTVRFLGPDLAGETQKERKRVAFALALATGPKLLLADEPAGGVDPGETEGRAELMRKIASIIPNICFTTSGARPRLGSSSSSTRGRPTSAGSCIVGSSGPLRAARL